MPWRSRRKITAICDICGKEKEKLYTQYYQSIQKHDGKYYCKNCFLHTKELMQKRNEKSKQTLLEKHGVTNPMKLEETKEKIRKTCLEKYGVENLMDSEIIKEKQKKTCLEKYGVENVLLRPDIQEKSKKAIKEKYGVDSALKLEWVKEKIKKSCLEKYGVEKPFQSEIIRKKAQKSLQEQGKVNTSSQQLKIYNLLKEEFEKCYLNFPLGDLSLDCAIEVNNVKIDIEYDGHYWHKNLKQKDRARDEIVKKQGYKILRIEGEKIIPSKEEISEKINILLNTDRYFEQLYTKDYLNIIDKEKANK